MESVSGIGGNILAEKKDANQISGLGRKPRTSKANLLSRRRDVLVLNHPLATLVLKDNRPAPSGQLPFAIFQSRIFLYCGSSPVGVSGGMDLGIVIHGELPGLIICKFLFHATLILIPTVILQRCDVEKNMRTLGIELCKVGRVESAPTVPDLLHIRFVGSRTGCLWLLDRFLLCRKSGKPDC